MKNIFSYKLQPPELEARFLKHNLPEAKLWFQVMAILIITVLIAFIVIDFSVFKEPLHLMISITSRIVAIAAAFSLILFSSRIHEPKQMHLFTFFMVLVVLINLLIAHAVRPSDQITNVAWSLMAIFTCYAAIPTSRELQTAATVFYTIGTCIVWFLIKKPAWSPVEIITIMGAYVYANICGFFISNQIALSRRHIFRLLNEEKSANKKLEAAIKEIKTLQGILPICAYCKKIRNDSGYWKQLEGYLTEHTDALFSHSVCPECLKKEHPSTYQRLLKKGYILPPESQ